MSSIPLDAVLDEEAPVARRLFVSATGRIPVVDATRSEGLVLIKRTHSDKPWALLQIDLWGDVRVVAEHRNARTLRAFARRRAEGLGS